MIKKIAYFMFAMVAVLVSLASCSDDYTPQSAEQIYFGQYYYTLGKTSVVLTLNADKAPDRDVNIPVHFGGDAKEGVDFEVPDKAFHLKAGQTEATMTINRIADNIPDDNLNLYVNLDSAPAGFSLGLANFATVSLMGNNGVLVSFSSAEGAVKFTEDFTVTLTSMKGGSYRPQVETKYPIEVKEGSTAVEGENFEFVDGPYVTVPKGKNKGTFSIKFLKKEPGKDKLILGIAEGAGYMAGSTPEMDLKVSGPDVFTGTWVFDKVSNKTTIEDGWSWFMDVSKIPTGTTADRLTFTGDSYEEYTLKPEMTGDFKNYFGNKERKIKFKEVASKYFEENWGSGETTGNVQILEIPDVNLKFSSTRSDYSRPALVGFRIIQDKESGEDILECVIDDFQPEGDDYGAQLYSEMGSMDACPLHLWFRRAK